MHLVFIVLGALTLCVWFQDTAAAMQKPVTAQEGENAELSIVFQDTSTSLIVVKLDKGDGSAPGDVVFAYPQTNGIKVRSDYDDRLSVDLTSSQNLRMTLSRVTSQDAGVFKCYSGLQETAVSDCGQMLIIIRKPNPPTIVSTSSPLVGSDLILTCQSSSMSLPANHGLSTDIWWTNENGEEITESARIRVNYNDQLVVENIERGDKGQKFYCQSADSTARQPLRSNLSPAYTLQPEFSPTRDDISLTPSLENDAVVQKQLNEEINYRCEANCQPACNITWLYQPLNSSRFGEVNGLRDRQVLQMYVSRTNEGSYRCKAENKYGHVRQNFNLEAMYMTSPEISINGIKRNADRMLENTTVQLKCEFDANPQPAVKWMSPTNDVLFAEMARGPTESPSNNGINKRMYVSNFVLEKRRCEESGHYKCEGENKASSATGNIDLLFTCPPASAQIPGLELQSQYVWEIPHTLSFKFVIRAVPPPSVTRIISTLNGSPREERMNRDVTITSLSNYDSKSYLTHFTFTSLKELTLADRGREYAMTLSSTEFDKTFRFTVQPRGPPYEVLNVTAEDVSHDSLLLFWRPGFNGGEEQTFTVDVRSFSPQQAEKQNNKPWQLIEENIADIQDGSSQWVELSVQPLQPSTNYVIRVRAFNKLGNSSSVIEIKTAAAPDEGLAAGAIVGIIFAVLIVIAIILALLYFFVYKKRWGKDGEGSETKFKFPEQLTALFSKKDKKNKDRGRGDDEDEEAPKNGPIYKLKNRMKRKPDDKTFVYVNVPAREEPDLELPAEADDGDYVNTEIMKPARSRDNIYENAPALNNNTDASKNQPVADSDGRTTNDEGLVYLSLEFPADKKKGKAGKAGKVKKGKNQETQAKKDRVDYADIDFPRMKEKQEELEAARKREAEEVAAKKAEEEEEVKRRAEKVAEAVDGDDAKDGGADEDGGRPASKVNRIPEQDFGTAV